MASIPVDTRTIPRSATAPFPGATSRPARRRLRQGAAFALLVSMLVVFFAAASAPTPLYASYRAQWGFGPLTVTAIFGVYAVAVLGALLTAGSLSDHVGRRPVLLGALGVQAVAMLVFLTADGVTALVLARIVQGLATGAAIGALGAALLDLDRERGAVANAVAAMAGTASGALVAGILVAYLPSPTHLVYAVILVLLAAQALAVVLMAETSATRPGAVRSLRPQLGIPSAARAPLLLALPTIVAVWALAGLYGSLGPAVAQAVVGRTSPLLGGLTLGVLAGAASLTVLLARRTDPARLMTAGVVALVVGVSITEAALVTSSPVLFFLGAAVAGTGFGGAFQGALRTVVPLAAPHERAGLLSAVFVASYLAFGVPAMVAGYLAAHGGLISTTEAYTAVVLVLSVTSLAGMGVRSAMSRRAAAAGDLSGCTACTV
ncbi:MAG TPA: MFS transporter [Candidatus Nanopelagicales bacterium]|nr:MFS transporter [Candidatus Nanopelagicales bacterium]